MQKLYLNITHKLLMMYKKRKRISFILLYYTHIFTRFRIHFLTMDIVVDIQNMCVNTCMTWALYCVIYNCSVNHRRFQMVQNVVLRIAMVQIFQFHSEMLACASTPQSDDPWQKTHHPIEVHHRWISNYTRKYYWLIK